jgi:DNA segregation ATPase FtsK/SpoIIIE, S-DNA-T family
MSKHTKAVGSPGDDAETRLDRLENLVWKLCEAIGGLTQRLTTAAPVPATHAPHTDEELSAKIAKLPVKVNTKSPARAAYDGGIARVPDYSGYRFPTLDLLDDPEGNYSENAARFAQERALVLTKTLETYGITGEISEIECGPVVTVYSVELEAGTRVAQLEELSRDIARALAVSNVRIIPVMPDSTAVGIEVPNKQKEKVRLKELMSGGHAQGMMLPMFMGKDSSGDPLVLDLAKMPHMLIAGTTGSGKSVCMNTIIMSFLYTKRPDELKLVLVDPKMVEMAMFADIPHLACPVVTEIGRAAAILEWAVTKMEERYELLKEAGVRDIKGFNAMSEAELREQMGITDDGEWARVMKKMPYMVFVIDELADLMMTNKDVEYSIVRIAQKARAVGIHLILATQRPHAAAVTGLIKSNMPCRVAFKVASGTDSRIVLDREGAELLLGHGDMLVVTPSQTDARRCQGTLVDDKEARGVVKFLKNVAAPNFERQLLTIRAVNKGEGGIDAQSAHKQDDLFDTAVEIIIESGRGSVSILQRRLAIGYGRASRLVDLMGQAGLLGEHRGSQAREVMVTMEEWYRIKELRDQQEREGTVFE